MSFATRVSVTLPLLVTFIWYWTMPPWDATAEVRLTCSVVALALHSMPVRLSDWVPTTR